MRLDIWYRSGRVNRLEQKTEGTHRDRQFISYSLISTPMKNNPVPPPQKRH